MMKKVLVLGFFDSLHIGHRFIIEKARQFANANDCSLCLHTFSDNFFVNIDKNIKQIYLLKERKHLFDELGIDEVVVYPNNYEFFKKSPQQFLDDININDIESIFVGQDYTFGYKGEGTTSFLEKYYADTCVKINIIPLLKQNSVKISSSYIRELLNSGEIEKANELLVDEYFVRGIVSHGRGQGKKLGIPTANIAINDLKLMPKEGVYITFVVINNKRYKSITNIGGHPTFDDHNKNIETYIFGMNNDVYGCEITVGFLHRIREIIKFDNSNLLIEQINKDIKEMELYD